MQRNGRPKHRRWIAASSQLILVYEGKETHPQNKTSQQKGVRTNNFGSCSCDSQNRGSVTVLGHTPSTAGTFRKKFRKNSGKTPETLSELFLEFPSRVRLGCPKPHNSRHLKAPEHFQNCLPPSTAGDASFFRSGSGEGLSEPVMEFPAVLGPFLTFITNPGTTPITILAAN